VKWSEHTHTDSTGSESSSRQLCCCRHRGSEGSDVTWDTGNSRWRRSVWFQWSGYVANKNLYRCPFCVYRATRQRAVKVTNNITWQRLRSGRVRNAMLLGQVTLSFKWAWSACWSRPLLNAFAKPEASSWRTGYSTESYFQIVLARYTHFLSCDFIAE